MAVRRIWQSLITATLLTVFEFEATLLTQAEPNLSKLSSTLYGTDESSLKFKIALQELLTLINRQNNYETLVLFKLPSDVQCPLLAALRIRDEPRIIFHQKIINYRQRFSKQTLVLRCEAENWTENVGIQAVLHGLRHVVYLQMKSFENIEETVFNYCEKAFKSGIFHVVVLIADFGKANRYMLCYRYPVANVKQRTLSEAIKQVNATTTPPMIFEPQFRDMQGATLWTQPDQRIGRSMVCNDSYDKPCMIGYVANLINLYASHHNATLRFRYPITSKQVISDLVMENETRNGVLDIAASMTTTMRHESLREVSYPYDVSSYCVMMPLPRPIHHYQVYAYILSPLVFAIICLYIFVYSLLLLYSTDRLTLATAFLNFEMVRAMLAQSFRTVRRPRLLTKFIIFQISYTCYLVSNMYSAFLQSYLTHPPLGPLLTSVPAAKAAGLKLLFPKMELGLLEGYSTAEISEIKTIIEIEDDFEKYDRIRTSMNMNYIYFVSDRRWQVFSENQKIFQRKIFHFRGDDYCMYSVLLHSFPINPYLPYRERFDAFILLAHATGFVQHWTDFTFFYMAHLKLLQLEDLSSSLFRLDNTLNLRDFRWIWIGYGCFTILSIIGFLLELLKKYWYDKRYKVVKK